jgi:cell division protein FtsB
LESSKAADLEDENDELKCQNDELKRQLDELLSHNRQLIEEKFMRLISTN